MPGLHLGLPLKAHDCLRRFENAADGRPRNLPMRVSMDEVCFEESGTVFVSLATLRTMRLANHDS